MLFRERDEIINLKLKLTEIHMRNVSYVYDVLYFIYNFLVNLIYYCFGLSGGEEHDPKRVRGILCLNDLWVNEQNMERRNIFYFCSFFSRLWSGSRNPTPIKYKDINAMQQSFFCISCRKNVFLRFIEVKYVYINLFLSYDPISPPV